MRKSTQSTATAKDLYGGDPMAPNDAMLVRIAKAAKGAKDDMAERWAAAYKEVCPQPVDIIERVTIEEWHATPESVRRLLHSPYHHRATLGEMADAILNGKKTEKTAQWAKKVLANHAAEKGAE